MIGGLALEAFEIAARIRFDGNRNGRGPHFKPSRFYNPGTGHGAAMQAHRELRRRHWQAFFHKDATVPVIVSRQVQRAGARALAKDLRSC